MDCRPAGSSVHGISRQEYWSGLLFPSPGGLPHLTRGNEPGPPSFQVAFCTAGKFSTDWTTGRGYLSNWAHFSWSYLAQVLLSLLPFLCSSSSELKQWFYLLLSSFPRTFFFFNVDHFLSVSMEFVTILLLFYVWYFVPRACETLTPWPGIGTWSLNQWTAREVPLLGFLNLQSCAKGRGNPLFLGDICASESVVAKKKLFTITKFKFHFLLWPVWPWTTDLTSMCFLLITCKVREYNLSSGGVVRIKIDDEVESSWHNAYHKKHQSGSTDINYQFFPTMSQLPFMYHVCSSHSSCKPEWSHPRNDENRVRRLHNMPKIIPTYFGAVIWIKVPRTKIIFFFQNALPVM